MLNITCKVIHIDGMKVVGKQAIPKRDIYCKDETGSIILVLWRERAASIPFKENVIAVENATVSTFNNVINLSTSSQIVIKRKEDQALQNVTSVSNPAPKEQIVSMNTKILMMKDFKQSVRCIHCKNVCPTDRRTLSSKMAHSQRTEQLWYDLTEKRESATEGFLLMEKIKENISGKTKEESPVKGDKVVTKKRTRKVWNKEDEVAIIKAFEPDIKSKMRPKIQPILEKFKKVLPEIYNIEDSKKHRERCFDKVRTLWDRNERDQNKEPSYVCL
ncbi:hypothetical protein AC249_AIPGENE6773 [Exaiptasia diaphana]|nr:hypothetical protein AC249_AIPGENE6773 [Exaiptasia diaphana]